MTCALLLVATGAAHAQVEDTQEVEAASVAAEAPLEAVKPEEVLVTGERPGPGLWKISKDNHVLWILGTHAPLAKAMSAMHRTLLPGR